MTRKFISFFLVLSLVFGLSVSCFAAYNEPSGTGYAWRSGGSSTANTTDFWSAVAYSASWNVYHTARIYDVLTSSLYGLSSINNNLANINTKATTTNNTLNSILQLMPTDYITQSDLATLEGYVSSLNTNWNSVLANSVGTGVLLLPNIDSTLSSSYSIQSTYLPYLVKLPTIDTTLGSIHTDTSSIDLSTQSIDTYTQQIDTTFDSFWTSLNSQSGSLTSYYYFQRPTLTNQNPQVPYKSLASEMIAMRAGWSGSSNTRVYDVAAYTRANLTLSDRLTILNENLVTSNLMTFTPQSSYSLDKIDYTSGVSTSWKPVSIADFLWWIGNNNSDALNRLAFMFADDDDISLKNDTSGQRDWVSDYYGSSSAPSTSDYDDVADGVSDFSSFLATGSSADLSTALSGLDDNTYDFWSQSVSNEINNTGNRSSPPDVVDFFTSNWEEILNIG